ncbi:Immunoglobulin-like fold [Phytophthora cinnamomi]|uniref:Immunoglobulin-like fold n=1 Tax=Phytophthora cinnamomi TaxID=4785 RepID=UPI00355A551B|nr:Immunoglobulin-like fold [Phytophthora cinnamomi]
MNGAPVLGYRVELARRVDEVQTPTVMMDRAVPAGGDRVTFTNARGSATTSCVAWYASAVELEMALEQLPNVDSVGVARAPYNAAKNGFVYTATFDGAYLVSGQQPTRAWGAPPPTMMRTRPGVSGFPSDSVQKFLP